MDTKRKTLDDIIPKNIELKVDRDEANVLIIAFNLLREIPEDKVRAVQETCNKELKVDFLQSLKKVVLQLSDKIHDKDWCYDPDCHYNEK